MDAQQVKIAFLILTDDVNRAAPGLMMATRLKANQGADVRVLFFGPGVKLASSGAIDSQLSTLREAGLMPMACTGNADQYGVRAELESRSIRLLAAGAEVASFAREGYTVLSF
ncbi:MAG: DsrE family protein [Candidatus Dormibacteria bacterium]